LVVQNGPRRMDVRFPAPPLRSPIYHCFHLWLSLMRSIDITFGAKRELASLVGFF
jgi:hypothetical protein